MARLRQRLARAWQAIWSVPGWVSIASLKVTDGVNPVYRRASGQFCLKLSETEYRRVRCQKGLWQSESEVFLIQDPQEFVQEMPLDWCYQLTGTPCSTSLSP